MSENVRVGVRLRPFNARELSAAAGSMNGTRGTPPRKVVPAWSANATTGAIKSTGEAEMRLDGSGEVGSKHEFLFDHVFDAASANEDVYGDLAKPVVDAAIAGYNGTVFAYGQTSSGKTHSMVGSSRDPGITPRAIEDVMRIAREAAGGRRYLVRVTYCEIYNEIIRDLLDEDAKELTVREDSNGRTFIDAQEVVVTSLDDAMEMLRKGQTVRSTAETAMNRNSSRSHTIFTLIIESRGDALGAEKSLRSSTLHLVDLAGSERAKSTKATGARLREGAHINKSLLTLGTIINKLSSGLESGHLPYRDSKLTRVLRQSLGGNARTAVLCAATPSPMHVEETLSTLKFAERAKKVTNSAIRNEIIDYKAKYTEASAEVLVLRSRIAELEGGSGMVSGGGGADEGSTDVDGDGNQVGAQVAIAVQLQRAKEEVAFHKERAETAELENARLDEMLKRKATELRTIRARTIEMCDAARLVRGREKALQHQLTQAFFQLEEARKKISMSKKKGSRVLQAADELYGISAKLAMFIPDEEFTRRGRATGGGGPSVSADVLPELAASASMSAIGRRPTPDFIPSRGSPIKAPPAVTTSPVTPASGRASRLRNGSSLAQAARPAPYVSRRRSRDAEASSQDGEDDTSESDESDATPTPQQSYQKPPGADPALSDRAVVDELEVPIVAAEESITATAEVDGPSTADGENAGEGDTLDAAKEANLKRKNKALYTMRSFYGGSSTLQDRMTGGRRVVS